MRLRTPRTGDNIGSEYIEGSSGIEWRKSSIEGKSTSVVLHKSPSFVHIAGLYQRLGTAYISQLHRRKELAQVSPGGGLGIEGALSVVEVCQTDQRAGVCREVADCLSQDDFRFVTLPEFFERARSLEADMHMKWKSARYPLPAMYCLSYVPAGLGAHCGANGKGGIGRIPDTSDR